MVKKRLIAVVTVRHGWAVQSISYNRYLPLGRPEVIAQNLDRWGADEILIQCIDRSLHELGPDLNLLKKLGALGLSTPLIYGGGIRCADDAVNIIRLGADRICVDGLFWDRSQELESISRELGSQALIVNMPLRINEGDLYWWNYRSHDEIILNKNLLKCLNLEYVSEIMLTDYVHEGVSGCFDSRLLTLFPYVANPLILFGGLSEDNQFQDMFSKSNVVGVCVGNFLNYKEHAVQSIKQNLGGSSIRPAQYAKELFSYEY